MARCLVEITKSRRRSGKELPKAEHYAHYPRRGVSPGPRCSNAMKELGLKTMFAMVSRTG